MSRMVDLLTRQQVFLEILKYQYWKERNPFYLKYFKDALNPLLSMDFDKLIEMNKTDFNAILRQVKNELMEKFDIEKYRFLQFLQQFMVEHAELTYDIMQFEKYRVINTGIKEGNVFPIPIGGIEKQQELLLTMVLPSTGDTSENFINGFFTGAIAYVIKELRKSRVNGLTPIETFKAIVGTEKNNYRDSIFSKVSNNNRAVINTVMQHFANVVNLSEISKRFDRYIWVSILDDKTTNICRSRNGNVYEAKVGNPLPPAHVNCRSKIVPYTKDNKYQSSFAQWLANQNEEFVKKATKNGKIDYNRKIKYSDLFDDITKGM